MSVPILRGLIGCSGLLCRQGPWVVVHHARLAVCVLPHHPQGPREPGALHHLLGFDGANGFVFHPLSASLALGGFDLCRGHPRATCASGRGWRWPLARVAGAGWCNACECYVFNSCSRLLKKRWSTISFKTWRLKLEAAGWRHPASHALLRKIRNYFPGCMGALLISDLPKFTWMFPAEMPMISE